ncbi:MAG: universal stress protein [Vicinamibacterales bacterium]
MRARTRVRDVVICGTDFTRPAHQAADVAALLAATLGRPLLLVHAVEPAAGARTARAGKALVKPRRDDLRAEAARLSARGATVIDEVHAGHADEVLAARARETAARLIVVASLGSRSSGPHLLGSVSERTAESAPVPTLVVRDAAPFRAWLDGLRPLKVFVGFDFTITGEAAFDFVHELRRAGPCDVTVGQASAPADFARVGPPEAAWSAAGLTAAREALERGLLDRARTLLDDEPAGVVIRPAAGHADAVLVEMAREAQADLIVTGTHQLRGLPRLLSASVSRGVLRHAPVSVAIAPATGGRRLPAVPAIRRVLVTTDFSPRGNRAVAHAFGLTPSGGTVRLVHVVHPKAVSGGEYETTLTSSARHDRYVQACGRRLRDLIPPEAGPLGISVETAVVERDDAARGICEEAERFGADVIVMGSQGRSALGRVVLGSVAQAVMAASTRPVFVVRSPKA